jgi:hypothetical protein
MLANFLRELDGGRDCRFKESWAGGVILRPYGCVRPTGVLCPVDAGRLYVA